MAATLMKQDLLALLLQKARGSKKGVVAALAGGLFVLSRLVRAWKLRKTPPGSFGWPVVGETLSFVLDAKAFVASRIKRNGPVFTTHVLFQPTAYLSGQYAKELFKNSHIAWPHTWNQLLGKTSMATISGAAHKKQRSVVSKAYSNEALASYLPRIQELTEKHLARWAERSAKETKPYDPVKDCQTYTFEVAEKVLLGRSTGDEDGGLIEPFRTWLGGFEALVPFDLPFTAHGKAVKAREELLAQYQIILDEKRKTMSADQKDMLALVMNAKDDEGQPMSDETLKDFCLLMMFAGHDTTKGAINSMMHLLSLDPQVKKELTEEVEKLWDGSSPITWEMIEALLNGKCGRFLGEQLRIMPVVTGVYRMLVEDLEVAGYTIPKGWKIMVSPAAVHTDLYDDKQTLDLTIDHSKLKDYEYMPFGGGARKCIGYAFARLELLVWMMALFRNYTFELDTAQTTLKTLPFITASVKARFHRRN